MIFIDDDSADGTFKRIKEIAAHDNRVRGIAFSKNFGKTMAIYAGIKEADADLVITKIKRILSNIDTGIHEFVMHPGYKSTKLITELPWAYSKFYWDLERNALQSLELSELIRDHEIELIRFSDL